MGHFIEGLVVEDPVIEISKIKYKIVIIIFLKRDIFKNFIHVFEISYNLMVFWFKK